MGRVCGIVDGLTAGWRVGIVAGRVGAVDGICDGIVAGRVGAVDGICDGIVAGRVGAVDGICDGRFADVLAIGCSGRGGR